MFFNTLDRLRHFEGKATLASDRRAHFKDDAWKGIRVKVILQTAVGGIAFMLWFLACLSYLYGTLYKSPERHDKLYVLAVDYDGGIIGQALEAAYTQLKGPQFFTLEVRSSTQYPNETDTYQAVWRGDYWASIAVTKGASERLTNALQGGQAAATYNPVDALHYVWDQQYYTTFAQSAILGSMNQLIAGTRLAYNKLNGTGASRILNQTDPAAVQVFLNPIQAKATNIKAASFGTVILLNTVSMAMPVLQQFFFLLVLNGVLAQHKIYSKMNVFSSLFFRRISGFFYTFGASLCQTGYYWAFREDWDVSGAQFVLTWITFWLLMHIHLLILDSISTIAPLPVMPFVVLLWVLINIASTLSPLELQAGFYHWGIALPSHEAYSMLMTIWTGGAHNRLYRALPILFAWWLLANFTTTMTQLRACHLAKKMELEIETEQTNGGTDIEAGVQSEAASGGDLERQTSIIVRQDTGLTRHRTVDEVALETRQAYGPSVPPLF